MELYVGGRVGSDQLWRQPSPVLDLAGKIDVHQLLLAGNFDDQLILIWREKLEDHQLLYGGKSLCPSTVINLAGK